MKSTNKDDRIYYFHVIIKQKVSTSLECIFKDISEEELKKNFINPYKLCNDLYYDGKILPIKEISRVIIKKTDESIENILKTARDKNLRKMEEDIDNLEFVVKHVGNLNNHLVIIEYGEDVLEKYLSAAPCEGTLFSNLLDTIKHPMIVRIFGGLLGIK